MDQGYNVQKQLFVYLFPFFVEKAAKFEMSKCPPEFGIFDYP